MLRRLAIPSFLVLFVTLCVSFTSGEEKKVQRWNMSISLDTPNLIPPAVQWAIFDKDPVPEFVLNIQRKSDRYIKELNAAEEEKRKRSLRNSQIRVNWNRVFRDITGDEVYLLTSAPNVAYSVASNAPEGMKWIAAKIVQIMGEPVCWCLLVEVKFDETIEVILTEENTLDLDTLYEDAMRKGPD